MFGLPSERASISNLLARTYSSSILIEIIALKCIAIDYCPMGMNALPNIKRKIYPVLRNNRSRL
jgi:hypothetical protein